MDQKLKVTYQKDVEKFLEERRVYDIFENLLQQLVINQPETPIDFLIQKLTEKQQKLLFIVGPPGSEIKTISSQLPDHLHSDQDYTVISLGNILQNEIGMKGEHSELIEKALKNCQFVKDSIIIDIVKKLCNQYSRERRNLIIEGFPRTRVQGLAMQREGIIPNAFIIMNQDSSKINQNIKNKLGKDFNFSKEELAKHASELAQEYELNLSQVKQIYQRYYFEVDGHEKTQQILDQMARLIKFKIRAKAPKRVSQILVMGPPGSGRSLLVKNIGRKYGLVDISTQQLIADQIARKTEVGRNALKCMKSGDLIGDDIINGLVSSRLNATDCHLQGYVLDGYPKNEIQMKSLENLKIKPSLIVVLDCDSKVTARRFNQRKIDPITGIFYDDLNPCTVPEIKKRLKECPNESNDTVKKRTQRWQELLKEIESNFADQPNLLFKVSGEDSYQAVFEKVSFQLENALL